MRLQPGARLGPSGIRDRLGTGGTGGVYAALDTRLDRTVAIKVLAPGLTLHGDARARFTQKARAASPLDHPHRCTIGAWSGDAPHAASN